MSWTRLQGQYLPMLLSALFVLIPYILTTSAEPLYREHVMQDLRASVTGLSVISGLSVAGYAFGAFLPGDLINRFRQRELYLIECALLVLGWSLAAAAPNIYLYGAGHVLAAFATGLLLVTALPPVIRRFPAARLQLADFIIAPVMLRIARLASETTDHSMSLGRFHEAVFVTLMIGVAATIAIASLLLLGGAALSVPNLEGWLTENEPAIASPPLLGLLRQR